VGVSQLSLIRGGGDADPANGEEKYVAHPLLMEAEGEIRLEGRSIQLDRGRGIAEFLVRKGFCPDFP